MKTGVWVQKLIWKSSLPNALFLSVYVLFTARKRSCGKVMFSQVFVCPWGGGGNFDRFGGMWQTGAKGEGGGFNPLSPNTTSDSHQSGRYASYWNAFLFKVINFVFRVPTSLYLPEILKMKVNSTFIAELVLAMLRPINFLHIKPNATSNVVVFSIRGIYTTK